MPTPPTVREVNCPTCDARAVAVVPKDSEIVEREARADGKVWVNCHTCTEQFLVYYRIDK